MKENPEHERWYREDYLARYPSPPRNKERLTEDECRKHGLRLVERERYTHEVSFLCRGAHQLPYDPEQRGRGHRERSRKLRKRAHVANKFLSPYVQEATRHLSVWWCHRVSPGGCCLRQFLDSPSVHP